MSKKLMQKVKQLGFGIVAGAMLLMTSAMPVLAQNNFISPSDNPQSVASATGGQGSIRQLALQIVNFFLGFLGIVAVMMIIYGGFLYVTAAGNDEKVGQAKKIIMYAVIGIIIILVSFAIVNTVLQAGQGITSN